MRKYGNLKIFNIWLIFINTISNFQKGYHGLVMLEQTQFDFVRLIFKHMNSRFMKVHQTLVKKKLMTSPNNILTLTAPQSFTTQPKFL